jgi:hypothetical protein
MSDGAKRSEAGRAGGPASASAASGGAGAAAAPALVLYGTTGCHLCDQAEALLRTAAGARALDWRYVDIALDDALVARYGTRIPVLLAGDGRELGWPFSLLDILRLA